MSDKPAQPDYLTEQYSINWTLLIRAFSLERFSHYYERVGLPRLIVEKPGIINSIARANTLSTYQPGQGKSVAGFLRELTEGYDKATGQAFYDWAVRYDIEPVWQRILGEWVSPFASFRSKNKNLERLNFKAVLIDRIAAVVQKYADLYQNFEPNWLAEFYYRAEIEGRLNEYLLETQQPPLNRWEIKLTELVQGSIGDNYIVFPISAALTLLSIIARSQRIFQIWQELKQLLAEEQQEELLAWAKILFEEEGLPADFLKLPLAAGVYPGEYSWE